MAKSGGPTVGLDIGSSLIKVAELVPGRNGVTVRAIGMAVVAKFLENRPNIAMKGQRGRGSCVRRGGSIVQTRQ